MQQVKKNLPPTMEDLPPMLRKEGCKRFAELQIQDFDLLHISRMIARENNFLASVGACLRISMKFISEIEKDKSCPKPEDKIHKILLQWQWKNTDEATWLRLIECLQVFDEQELMEDIKKYLSEKECPVKGAQPSGEQVSGQETALATTTMLISPTYTLSNDPITFVSSAQHDDITGSQTANVANSSSDEHSPPSPCSPSALVTGKSSASEENAGALCIPDVPVNAEVRRKTKLMEERFAGLLVAASDELETLKTRVDRVRLYLTSLKASTQVGEPLFDQYTLSLLKESSLNQIFTILSRTGAVNFLNFRLLQLVVKKFGNQNLKDQVEKYGEEVTKFIKETKFTDFYRIWSGQAAHGSVPNYQLLVVKLDREWPEATLSTIAEMENFLAGEFQLNAFIFRFSQANPGCVSLVWLIPACAARLIKEAMKTKQPNFSKMNIQELVVNGEVLFQAQKWSPLHSDFSIPQEECGRTLSRAVNNAKHLGVRFIDPIEIITCDTCGHEYYNTRHDVEIRIPEGAIAPSEGKINIEIGVAMYGPFKLSDEISRRVSPVVWLCVQNDGFKGFQKDVEITIPHFLDFSTEYAYEYLRFLKAEHQLEDSEKQYQLKPTGGRAVFDHGTHGTLLMRHFCSVCIVAKVFPDQRTRYYLGGGVSLKGQDWQIIFYVCYFLKSCVRTAEKLLDKDSQEIYLKDFMFSEGKELKIKFQDEVSGWLLNVERFNKISSKDVDFQSMIEIYGLHYLELMEERKLYPPNFEITVRRSRTAEDSHVDFTFQGATEEIVKRISLNTPKANRSQLPPPYVVYQKIDLECVDGTTVLDEDDLRDVRSAVADLTAEWMNFGISLGVRKSDLDPILSANSKSPSDCLREMLTVWLRQGYKVGKFGKPTWRRVVEAVEDKVGGNNPALAENIARKHPAPGSQ